MKKLIWKVLSRNAKARKSDRNDAKFASLCFYQLIMKRSMKGLRAYKSMSKAKKALIAQSSTALARLRL